MICEIEPLNISVNHDPPARVTHMTPSNLIPYIYVCLCVFVCVQNVKEFFSTKIVQNHLTRKLDEVS